MKKGLAVFLGVCALAVMLFCPAVWADVAINGTNFPDPVFREFVKNYVWNNGDDVLTDTELQRAKSAQLTVRLTQGEYTSLKGLELIPGIKVLDIMNLKITELDLSGYNDMERLSISNTPLVSLNVSSMKGLKDLYCSSSVISSLKINGCSSLERVEFIGSGSPLTEIDFSGCTSLRGIAWSGSELTALDLSMCPDLVSVKCLNSPIISLNVSSSSELESLICTDTRLTALDLRGNPKLAELNCTRNNITHIDFPDNSALETVRCNDNDLMSIDVSGLRKLKTLEIGNNHLTELDLSSFSGTNTLQRVEWRKQERSGAEIVSLGLHSSGTWEYQEYQLDMSRYVSDISRLTNGYTLVNSDDNEAVAYVPEEEDDSNAGTVAGGIVTFRLMPEVNVENCKIYYAYKTGLPERGDGWAGIGVYLRDLKVTDSAQSSPGTTPSPAPANPDDSNISPDTPAVSDDENATPNTPNTPGNSDRSSVVTFNGHRYQVFDIGMTWTQAKAYCESMDGYLATITSQAEQKAVEELVFSRTRNSYWIGGRKNASGLWSWIDGLALSYTNWAEGSPDSSSENSRLMMYRVSDPSGTSKPGTWNGVPDDGRYDPQEFFGTENFGFVCEWGDTDTESSSDSSSGGGGGCNAGFSVMVMAVLAKLFRKR